jgi:hypothetical protein
MHKDQFTESVNLGAVYMAISPYHREMAAIAFYRVVASYHALFSVGDSVNES